MKELEEKLRSLKLRKARLFSDIEMLSDVNDSAFLKFGKLEFEILKAEKDLIRLTENIFQ